MNGVMVLTHGKFGEDLVKTACGIMKETEKVTSLNLSRRQDFQSLRKTVAEGIQALQAEGGVLILIDAYGGTSYNTTLPLVNEQPICIVTGVNLPMVLSALANRHRMPIEELAKKVMDDARKTISTMCHNKTSPG
jgi:PTS system mannose-specific IIA component